MANEKLIIKKFAGFDDIEIEFKAINVFIGPQAAGKSVIIKLAYYFKSILSEINNIGYDEDFEFQEIINIFRNQFCEFFPKDSWGNDIFKIKYQIEDTMISINRDNNLDIKISLSTNIIETIKKKTKVDDVISKIQSSELVQIIIDKRQLFIPAGRSFFSNIQNNIFLFLRENQSIDPFLIRFGSFYESFKIRFLRDKKEIDLKSQEILKGNYLRKNQQDYIMHHDNRMVNILNASSGQQEILPLLITLDEYNSGQNPLSLYVEEPEAHLYPIAQKKIVQLLAHVFNSGNKQLFITTHSPYILAAFNNLLEAGNVIKEKQELAEKVYSIVPKDEILDISDFIAYSIKDGKKEVLINEETNLISQNILDEVSDEIAEEFSKLLDLEFEGQ